MSEDSGPTLRIGNAERDAAVKALDAHLTAGRIDLDEYGSRYALALVARTMSDLQPLFADLPAPGPLTAADQAGRPSNWRSIDPSGARAHALSTAAWRIAPAMLLIIPVAAFTVVASRGFFLPFFLFFVFGRLAHRGRGWGYAGADRRRGCST